MSKYTFERLGPHKFENLAQALLEKLYRTEGHLTQFGPGADGGREATWLQPVNHPGYTKPSNEILTVPKQWVFQVKYHDITLRGWDSARSNVEQELDKELQKVLDTNSLTCHKYVLITNVPFTGLRHLGTRDRITTVISKWSHRCPEIEVWDASDLSRMLDADPGTRTTYLGEILPGDVLRALLENTSYTATRRASAFRAYLRQVLRVDRAARTEDAGDLDAKISLDKIFVDLSLQATPTQESLKAENALQQIQLTRTPNPHEEGETTGGTLALPASQVLLKFIYPMTLLLGGPGVGKSTITQFVGLYHAARLAEPGFASQLLTRFNQHEVGGQTSDSDIQLRFPFRIELRRFAKWINDLQEPTVPSIALYLSNLVNIAAASPSATSPEDIFGLAGENAICLILDGLDEIPDQQMRSMIFASLSHFLDRCDGESADIQVIVSSRPQGYQKEFAPFEPIQWITTDLEEDEFYSYASAWLSHRVLDPHELGDAERQVRDAMLSPAVENLAKTLLQATVMLTLVAGKQQIPHARYELFGKYVDVIFARERNKETVRNRDKELRRLHERVGYELMRSMESRGPDVDAVSLDDLNIYIREIMGTYGSRDLGELNIDDVAAQIVLMARDRLCLLSGKGELEESVGFVIPQFREYFAARYFASHEDADSDKVFSTLVARGEFWINVLQFYVAMQPPASQRLWLLEASPLDPPLSLQDIIAVLRAQRCLLQVLPEMSQIRVHDGLRFLRGIFAPETIWATRVDSILQRLARFLPQESCWNSLARYIDSPGDLDKHTYQVVASLCVYFQSPQHHDALAELITIGLSNSRLKEGALNAIGRTATTIGLPLLSIEDLVSLSSDYRFSPFGGGETDVPLCRLSEKAAVDLSLCFPRSTLCEASAHEKLINRITEFTDAYVDNMTTIGTCSSRLRRFLVNKPPHSDLAPAIELLRRLDTPVCTAFVRIVEAMLAPTDPALHRAARMAHAAVGEAVGGVISIDELIGPPPSIHNSDVEWIQWKSRLMSLADAAAEDFEMNPGYAGFDKLSFLLMCKPSCWDLLSAVVPKEQVLWLEGRPLALLLAESPIGWFPLLVGTRRIEHDGRLTMAVIDAVVTICERGSSDQLFDVGMLYFDATWSSFAVKHSRTMLERARKCGCVPKWCMRYLHFLVCGSEDFRIEDLGDRQVNIAAMSAFANPRADKQILRDVQRTVDIVVNSGSIDDIILAARLMYASRKTPLPISSDEHFHARASELLRDESVSVELRRELAADLIVLPISLQLLADIICDTAVGPYITGEPYYEHLAMRMLSSAAAISRTPAERSLLLETIDRLINCRANLGFELRDAVVEVAVRMQDVDTQPIERKDWQV